MLTNWNLPFISHKEEKEKGLAIIYAHPPPINLLDPLLSPSCSTPLLQAMESLWVPHYNGSNMSTKVGKAQKYQHRLNLEELQKQHTWWLKCPGRLFCFSWLTVNNNNNNNNLDWGPVPHFCPLEHCSQYGLLYDSPFSKRSYSGCQVSLVSTTHGSPLAARGRTMGEKWWPNGAWDMHPGFFCMPQICDMGPIILLPFWRKACWGLFIAL